MFNWTHDLPPDSRLTFENVLALLRPRPNPKILEIGVFVGTSLIGMLNFLPSAKATAIDNWKLTREECDYGENLDIRETFISNVTNAGVAGRVTLYDGDSTPTLFQLIENKETFDFIYIDGSHKCLEVYIDIILAWELLETGGILGMDDYEWDNEDILDGPKVAIDYFLEKYAGKYLLLDKGYRVFVLKR